MIIDSHVYIFGPPREAEPGEFAQLMKKSKIDRAVVFRYVPGQPTEMGNKAILLSVNEFPERFIGFAWIDPNSESAVNEMREAVLNWKFKGIKIHMELGTVSEEGLRRVLMEAERLSVPACIHVGEDLEPLDKIVGECRASIIVAHLGTGVYNLDPVRLENAVELAQKHERIYLETSGNTYFFIEYAVRKLGPHKVIFGSDFPHEHPLVQVRAIDLLNLPESDKDLILAGNILELISPIS